MPKFLKVALAVLAGFAAWFVIATLGNLVLRAALPGYSAVERAMDFTLAMLIARILLAVASCVFAGVACAAVWRFTSVAAYLLATLLVVFFIPVHISLWNKFPIWYHAVFLLSLAPVTLLGFRLATSRATNAA